MPPDPAPPRIDTIPRDVLLVTLGSHGDVHPFVGLGRRLAGRGHRVTLLTNGYFRSLAEAAGLDFAPIGEAGEFLEMARHPDLWHPRRGVYVILDAIVRSLRVVCDAVAERASADTLVVGSTLAVGARLARDAVGFAMATAHLAPVALRSEHELPRLPGLPAWLGRLPPVALRNFWAGADKYVFDPRLAPAVNALRGDLGLPAVDRIMHEWWHSPDRVLAMWPEWFAPPPPDFLPQARCVGFPRYDEADVTPLPASVADFLDAGDPPVAFTPGSAMQSGGAFFASAARACERLGRRGLLLTRHAHQIPPDLPPGVVHVPYAPFSALLPRCATVVHHGGVGTLSQGLAAGVPQLVMGMAHDQLDNAARLQRLGVGEPISPRRFTPRRVAAALSRLTDSPAVASRCAEVSRRFDGVDALGAACDEVEALSRAGAGD